MWNPNAQCRIHKSFPIIDILSRINPISHNGTYLFNFDFIIAISRHSHRSLSSTFTCSIFESTSNVSHSGYKSWPFQTFKFNRYCYTYIISVLLSCSLRLVLLRSVFPVSLRVRIFKTSSHSGYMPCPSQLLDLIAMVTLVEP